MRRRKCPFEDVQVDRVVLRVLRGRGESKVDEHLEALACTITGYGVWGMGTSTSGHGTQSTMFDSGSEWFLDGDNMSAVKLSLARMIRARPSSLAYEGMGGDEVGAKILQVTGAETRRRTTSYGSEEPGVSRTIMLEVVRSPWMMVVRCKLASAAPMDFMRCSGGVSEEHKHEHEHDTSGYLQHLNGSRVHA